MLRLGRLVKAKFSSLYPYKFGGVSSFSFPVSTPWAQGQLLFATLGREITKNFEQAYRVYLQTLENRDVNQLRSMTVKQLNNKQDLPAVQLMNRDEKIVTKIGKQRFVIGVGLDRDEHRYQTTQIGRKQVIESNLKIYHCKKPIQGFAISILYSAQVYFRSKVKLILTNPNQPKTPQQLQKQQIHMLQFEFENRIYFPSLFVALSKLKFQHFFDNKKFSKAMSDYILGVGHHQWKIGDVDGILNGNFPSMSK